MYLGNGETSLGVAEGIEYKKLILDRILERVSSLTPLILQTGNPSYRSYKLPGLGHNVLISFRAFCIISHSFLLLIVDTDYFPESKEKKNPSGDLGGRIRIQF